MLVTRSVGTEFCPRCQCVISALTIDRRSILCEPVSAEIEGRVLILEIHQCERQPELSRSQPGITKVF